MSELIQDKIEVQRALEIMKHKTKANPTVDELRIMIRDCADCDNPVAGIITARDIVKEIIANPELSIEDRIAFAQSDEFKYLSDKLGGYLE